MKVLVNSNYVNEWRLRNNLTLKLLARRLGISGAHLYGLRGGMYSPSGKLRKKMLAIFNCEFDDLFSIVDTEATEAQEKNRQSEKGELEAEQQ